MCWIQLGLVLIWFACTCIITHWPTAGKRWSLWSIHFLSPMCCHLWLEGDEPGQDPMTEKKIVAQWWECQVTAAPCHTTSPPSLFNLPLHAWQRSTARPAAYPPFGAILFPIPHQHPPRAEEPWIFTEGARPFKHCSVVIICSLSLWPLLFSTHRVPMWSLAHLREGQPKEQCRTSFLDQLMGFNLVTIVLIIEIELCVHLQLAS